MRSKLTRHGEKNTKEAESPKPIYNESQFSKITHEHKNISSCHPNNMALSEPDLEKNKLSLETEHLDEPFFNEMCD